MRLVGIDYSLTSPAICIHDGEEWSFSNCKLYAKTGIKTYSNENVTVSSQDVCDDGPQRFDLLSDYFMTLIEPEDKIFIEDYAFAAKGLVFKIAENTGLLKYKLYKNGNSVTTIAPSAVKKFASGKGNSDKNAMYAAFQKEGNINTIIDNKIGKSPSADLVDSYFVCKFGFYKERENICHLADESEILLPLLKKLLL